MQNEARLTFIESDEIMIYRRLNAHFTGVLHDGLKWKCDTIVSRTYPKLHSFIPEILGTIENILKRLALPYIGVSMIVLW